MMWTRYTSHYISSEILGGYEHGKTSHNLEDVKQQRSLKCHSRLSDISRPTPGLKKALPMREPCYPELVIALLALQSCTSNPSLNGAVTVTVLTFPAGGTCAGNVKVSHNRGRLGHIVL